MATPDTTTPPQPLWLGQVREPGGRWRDVCRTAGHLEAWDKVLAVVLIRGGERRVVHAVD
jgi:hypothetical protein